MNCEAPRHPEGCVGAVVAFHGVPLCEAHVAAFGACTGPWRTPAGAREWLEGMANVVRARGAFEQVGVPLEDPSADKKAFLPWVPHGHSSGFAWIGGSPAWDSSDGRYRVANSLAASSKKNTGAKKIEKEPENTGKTNKNFWHWEKFKKKKKG